MEKIDLCSPGWTAVTHDWLAQRREYHLAGELTPGRADTAIGTISSTGSAVWRNLLPGK